MFITIDPYYTLEEFHKCIAALKDNGIEPKMFIDTRAPYNWYIDVESAPMFVFYDVLNTAYQKYLANVVTPVTSADEMYLFRRDKGLSKGRYVLNDAFKDAQNSDYACFINLQNKEEGVQLSRSLKGKIWYLGRYYGNKYKICLVTSEYVKNFVPKERILLEKTSDIPGRFEADLNYEIMYKKDRIIKFSSTPYFENGEYVVPTPIIQDYQKFIQIQ